MNQEKKPRYNCYRCEYGCNNFTVDVDEGVTPFMIKCKAVSRLDRKLNPLLTDKSGECIGNATSCFYPKAPLPSYAVVRHEWVKPTKEQIDAERKIVDAEKGAGFYEKCGQVEAYEKGQLMLVPRTDREPKYHV